MRSLKEFNEELAKLDVALRNAKKNRHRIMNDLHEAQSQEDAIILQ